jgi:molecular chaperone DnaJ
MECHVSSKSTKRDYYEVLGIARDADSAQVKHAYRKLVMLHHPDRNRGNPKSEQSFKEATEAFEVLSDVEKRRHYDLHGHPVDEPLPPPRPAGPQTVDDFIRHFSTVLDSLFNTGATQASQRQRHVKLCSACKGTGKTMYVQGTYKLSVPCPLCGGTGEASI